MKYHLDRSHRQTTLHRLQAMVKEAISNNSMATKPRPSLSTTRNHKVHSHTRRHPHKYRIHSHYPVKGAKEATTMLVTIQRWRRR